MIWAFGEEVTLHNPTADDLTGKRPLDDIHEGKTLIVRKLERIERETAKKIESMGLESIDVLVVEQLAEATLEQDKTTNMREAILDIFKRLRPGEAATEDAAKQLVYNQFFDIKRYDLGKVGRRFLNSRYGGSSTAAWASTSRSTSAISPRMTSPACFAP